MSIKHLYNFKIVETVLPFLFNLSTFFTKLNYPVLAANVSTAHTPCKTTLPRLRQSKTR